MGADLKDDKRRCRILRDTIGPENILVISERGGEGREGGGGTEREGGERDRGGTERGVRETDRQTGGQKYVEGGGVGEV